MAQIREITIPDSVTEIADSAFSGCSDLRSVTFGKHSRLEKIGQNAFAHTGLEVFTAPPSLRTISQAAFYECGSLKLVILNEGLEVLETDEESTSDGDSGVFQGSAVE